MVSKYSARQSSSALTKTVSHRYRGDFCAVEREKKKQRRLDLWFWEAELGKVSKTRQQVFFFIAAVNLFSDFDRSPPDPWERQVSSRHSKQEVVL